ncbi:MAG: biopolymer transporter ExbD [Bdellovibrionales bacterium]|nr:biopolymer transporter ExbD [Bdellovibrionales bacterium]
MASIGGDSGGKKDLNVELNLVPFIDLMSVCIIFLLITAVWTQVSMIQLGTSIYAKATNEGQVEPKERADVMLRVDVRGDGYTLIVGRTQTMLPKINGEFDETRLKEALKQVKASYAEKQDAVVSVADELSYEVAVKSIDLISNSGFAEVSIASQGGN